MKLIFLAVGMLLPVLWVTGQQTPNRIEIGDDVSSMTFPQSIRNPKSTLTIGDYKGKVVILDFWSTWCSACFRSFEPTINLQEKYKEDVVIISVNTYQADDSAAVEKAIGRWEKGQKKTFTLPIVLYDSVNLWRLMPTGMPHYMWIDRNGIFKGSSRDDSFNEPVIQAVIAGDFTGIRQSRRKFIDYNAHLMADNAYPEDSIMYSSVLGGYDRERHSSYGIQYDTASRIKGLAVSNGNICMLYQVTDSLIDKLPLNRFYMEGVDQNTLYCYQLWYRGQTLETMQKQMRSEIDRLLQVRSGWENREVDCWVLSVADHRKLPVSHRTTQYYTLDDSTADTVSSYNAGLGLLVAFLNTQSPVTIVNESGYTGKLDLDLPNGMTLEATARYLRRYGLSLVRSIRLLPVFVVKHL